MTEVLIALGSNLGDRKASLNAAIERMRPAIAVLDRSHIYETPPMYYGDQPAFLNMAIRGETSLTAYALLDRLKALESELGRVPSVPNGPRAIDLDIVFFGRTVMQSSKLTLPHPRVHERAFVLVPLADIAADFVCPERKVTIREMLDVVSGREEVVRFDGGDRP